MSAAALDAALWTLTAVQSAGIVAWVWTVGVVIRALVDRRYRPGITRGERARVNAVAWIALALLLGGAAVQTLILQLQGA